MGAITSMCAGLIAGILAVTGFAPLVGCQVDAQSVQSRSGIWLARKASQRDVGTADAAGAELTRRLCAGELSADDAHRAVDRIIHRAQDRKPWSHELDEFIAVSWERQIITPADLSQYLRASQPDCWVDVPSKVARLRWVQLAVQIPGSPALASVKPTLLHEFYAQSMTLDDQSLHREHISLGTYMVGGRPNAELLTCSGSFAPELRYGKHTLTIVGQIRVRQADKPWPPMPIDGERTDHGQLAEWTVELKVPIEVIPIYSGIRLVPDKQAKEAVQRSIFVKSARAIVQPDGRVFTWLSVAFARPPTNVAFDVFWRDGISEHRCGTLAALKDEDSICDASSAVTGMIESRAGIDVVLRPSTFAARASELNTILDEEITIRNIPVEWTSAGDGANSGGP
jgi:hypothetical protein